VPEAQLCPHSREETWWSWRRAHHEHFGRSVVQLCAVLLFANPVRDAEGWAALAPFHVTINPNSSSDP